MGEFTRGILSSRAEEEIRCDLMIVFVKSSSKPIVYLKDSFCQIFIKTYVVGAH